MFVIYLSSKHPLSAETEEYGYWTGKSYVVQGASYPVCDSVVGSRTKTYSSKKRAESAAQILADKFAYVTKWSVEEYPNMESGESMSEVEKEKPKYKTTTSTAVKRRYMDKVYTRIYADLPKQLVADFKAATKRSGTSTAEVFRKTMEQFLAENPLEK